MTKSDLIFVKGKALAFLLERARACDIRGPYGLVTKAAHLAYAGVLLGCQQNARKVVNGLMPLTPEHVQHIRERLKILGPEWDAQWAAITKRRDWELTAEGIETLTSFFSKMRYRGLEEAVAFAPRHDAKLELAAFCVPARVITEDEWTSIVPASNDPAAAPSSEVEALLARRACGVLFNGWLGRAHQRVVLQGEPGEGKTTAVWLYVAELCHRWEDRLRSNTHQDSAELIPLVLPLSIVAAQSADDQTVTELALSYVLALVRMETDQINLVRQWLGKKISTGQYVLLLDALDELAVSRLPLAAFRTGSASRDSRCDYQPLPCRSAGCPEAVYLAANGALALVGHRRIHHTVFRQPSGRSSVAECLAPNSAPDSSLAAVGAEPISPGSPVPSPSRGSSRRSSRPFADNQNGAAAPSPPSVIGAGPCASARRRTAPAT